MHEATWITTINPIVVRDHAVDLTILANQNPYHIPLTGGARALLFLLPLHRL